MANSTILTKNAFALSEYEQNADPVGLFITPRSSYEATKISLRWSCKI